MSDAREAREMAEKLVYQWDNHGRFSDTDGRGEPDEVKLARVILAQQPADEGEALTPALLESHGFYQLCEGGSWTHQDVGWYLSLDSGSVFYDGCTFCTVANKGEFLALLRFLGIGK